MITRMKKVVESVDVTKLSITELYYYFLLLKELNGIHNCKILSYGVKENSIITEEDYCD